MKKCLAVGVCATSLFINNCLATTEIKPFVGANIAITSVVWTDYVKDIYEPIGDLPISYWGIGIDVGARFANDNMYNCGITLTYDYVNDSKVSLASDAKPYVSSIRFGFSDFGLMFDNYLRVSEKDEKRSDIVLGIGLASVKERVYFLPTATGVFNGLEKIDDYDRGGAFVFKIGYNSKIDDRWDWNVTGRWFAMGGSSKEKDLDLIFNLGFGLRYVF